MYYTISFINSDRKTKIWWRKHTYLTHFKSVFYIYNPENARKPELLSSGGIEAEHWLEVGYNYLRFFEWLWNVIWLHQNSYYINLVSYFLSTSTVKSN